MDLAPALHCDILLVIYQLRGSYTEVEYLVIVYWMEQNCLLQCFSTTLSEDSFTLLFFLLPFVRYFCL